jgi:enolase
VTGAPSPLDRVHAWEALDSRGNPTVGCSVWLAGARGTAIVPAGASTGGHEAREARDGGARFGGRGVRGAVAAVLGELADAVCDGTAFDQRSLDARMRAVDGTPDLSRLGANAVLGVSLAFAAASARAAGLELYEAAAVEPGSPPLLPLPMINVVSGGAHADGAVDIQDILAVPVRAASFAEAIELVAAARQGTVDEARARGHDVSLVADEGGLAPRLARNREAIELVVLGIERAGLRAGADLAIAIDVAANQIAAGDGYDLRSEGRHVDARAWADEVASWLGDYPVVSIEDPLAEDDWPGWTRLTERIGERVQLLGDDLFATSPERLRRGIDGGVANAVLVKPNQIGTLSDALDVTRTAQFAGYRTVLSARSGDSEDGWLADLAIAWRTGQIKVGSLVRSERTAKWNRLLQIESELGADARFAGGAAIGVRRLTRTAPP